MHKFDILDPELNILESRFLEASAGTGKTFAIEHLFVRLLKEKDFSLQEVLAVTFTREAAHEMKMRIRQKLEETAAEDIQVFTIHGFCHRMLTEFAFEAKIPFEMSDPEQRDHLKEMRQVVEDFFRIGSKQFAPEVGALLRKERYDLDRLIQKILAAMQKKEEPTPFSLPDLSPKSFDQIWNDFLLLEDKYKQMKFPNHKEQVETFATYLETKDPDLIIGEKSWFFEKLRKEEDGYFHHLRTKFLPPLEIFRDSDEMIKRIAKECRERWEVKAYRGDHFTFDELLTQMQKSLSIPAFRKKVADKYKAVIVDEFQDTDPVQWDIFKTLFLDTHLLYLVGDPKQSIYSFRSADIYTYMKAGEAVGNRAYLDTNYRSSPNLVAALNDLFTRNPEWIELPSMPGALQYHPVHAGRSENRLTEEPITCFGVMGDPGRERSWPTKKMEEVLIFPYIAKEIIRLKKTLQFSDFAVLIKDRFQAQRLQSFFQNCKIPSVVKRTLSLSESGGFLAMEMLLKAIIHPDNDANVRAVLKGPLMNTEENPFYLLREMPFAKAYAHFLNHYLHVSSEELFREFSQTAELLLQMGNVDYQELLHQMQKWKGSSPETDPALAIRGGDSEDKVAIMTTFASKGLEFEVVFALGMASIFEKEDAEQMRQLYVAFTRAREKLYIPRLFGAPPKKPLSPIERFFQNIDETVNFIEIEEPPIYIDTTKKPVPKPLLKPILTFEKQWFTSFSAMAKPKNHSLLSEEFRLQDLTQKTPHTLPLGAETGTVIHGVLENYFQNREIERSVYETLIGTHLEGWEEVIANMTEEVLKLPLLDNFTLSDLQEGEFFQEMEFLFPQQQEIIKGFADLVFQCGDTFYVLDWKTNWLGPTDANYTDERLHLAMHEHDYYLQAKLYNEALRRYVKRFYTNPKFGGAFYVFLRGKKAVHIGTG